MFSNAHPSSFQLNTETFPQLKGIELLILDGNLSIASIHHLH